MAHNETDKMVDLLDAAMTVIEAVLDYEVARRKNDQAAMPGIRSRMFKGAHVVMDMRLKNLQDALNCDDDPDYQEYLRRN